ncbi:MAG: right-handed parallel beta-helix repeat-containing protein [Oscillospiraceae bacterium]|jgi:hypothetical protein|nr:right-handed parallel beta-helix repeat-containing protein [Oscillospiraceae bacterium]
MKHLFDITDFGAVGDGKTLCTAAVQRALDKAGMVCGGVVVPPGNYLCGELRVPRGVNISGSHAWSFRHGGSSILTLASANERCLLNFTGAVGCTIQGISLEGSNLGECIHGIYLSNPEYNGAGEEDTPTIEDCRVSGFSGDAVHLNHIWCFSVRHCMLAFCGGHGLYVNGWDGFVLDNWMSGNHGAGLFGDKAICSMTLTGNRVEWNRLAGFYIHSGNTLNITGNYFDRSGGPAIDLNNPSGCRTETVTITGNVFNRSGAGDFAERAPADSHDSAHVRMERCANTVLSGNSFRCGMNDGGGGVLSPDYSVVLRHLRGCVIKDNAMLCGAVKQNILDLGGHEEGVIIKDNVGVESAKNSQWYPTVSEEA